MEYISPDISFIEETWIEGKRHTSSPGKMSRSATTSMATDFPSVKMYFATALGVHEWLKSRLARGKTPWPILDKWEWMTKLLFPNKENIVSMRFCGGVGRIEHMVGVGKLPGR